MIRPFTLITMLLAALSGAYLFAVKHRAQVLDDQLAATAQESRLDAQRIRVLQAQWALEIDPTRLAQLAGQFTSLQPMQPAQLVAMASLAADLPPAGTPPPGENPQGDAPGLSVSPVEAVAANGLPYPPALPPGTLKTPVTSRIMVAAAPARQSMRQPVRVSAAAAPIHTAHTESQFSPGRSALHLAQTRLVEALPPPRPLPFTPATGAADNAVMSAPTMSAQLVSVKTTEDGGGSALGMAADLAPPQPLPESAAGN
jgi:hypothetical protein